MCTVTVVRADSSAAWCAGPARFRLVCNRDEQRSRPPSSPPVCRQLGARAAIMPIDPTSGGTWIGANDAGLIACLLNTNPPTSDPHRAEAGTARRELRSRGEIVPALLGSSTIEEARGRAGGIDARWFPPFRVLVLGAEACTIVSSDGASLSITDPAPLESTMLLTSSGLGDEVVECPRREVFEELMFSARDRFAAQDEFHRHRWPRAPQLSVLMSRPDARTVCRSEVTLFSGSIVFSHVHLDDDLDAGAAPSVLELLWRRAEVVA